MSYLISPPPRRFWDEGVFVISSSFFCNLVLVSTLTRPFLALALSLVLCISFKMLAQMIGCNIFRVFLQLLETRVATKILKLSTCQVLGNTLKELTPTSQVKVSEHITLIPRRVKTELLEAASYFSVAALDRPLSAWQTPSEFPGRTIFMMATIPPRSWTLKSWVHTTGSMRQRLRFWSQVSIPPSPSPVIIQC